MEIENFDSSTIVGTVDFWITKWTFFSAGNSAGNSWSGGNLSSAVLWSYLQIHKYSKDFGNSRPIVVKKVTKHFELNGGKWEKKLPLYTKLTRHLISAFLFLFIFFALIGCALFVSLIRHYRGDEWRAFNLKMENPEGFDHTFYWYRVD